jgi:hypothetical protein
MPSDALGSHQWQLMDSLSAFGICYALICACLLLLLLLLLLLAGTWVVLAMVLTSPAC